MSERTQDELKAAEEEWTRRIFAEIDEMAEDDGDPDRVDAEWLAGRKLQCELYEGLALLRELSDSREFKLYIGADGRYGKRVADFLCRNAPGGQT